MIEYGFEIVKSVLTIYDRAYCQWDGDLQRVEKVVVVLGNLKNDIENWDEFMSGIEAMYICETICYCNVKWENGNPIPLCDKRYNYPTGDMGCPIMYFIVEKLKLKYKLNLESLPNELLLRKL